MHHHDDNRSTAIKLDITYNSGPNGGTVSAFYNVGTDGDYFAAIRAINKFCATVLANDHDDPGSHDRANLPDNDHGTSDHDDDG